MSSQKKEIENTNTKLTDYKEKYKKYIINPKNIDKQIPTCSIKLNKILGGGLQPGKIVEIYGHEGSGKSSLSLSICAALSKINNQLVCIIDTEGGICSQENLKNIGISQENTLIIGVSEGEKVFNISEEIIKEKIFSILVIDSVAGILTEEDISDGSSSLGSHARLISKRLRRLIGILNESNSKTIVILINQIRNKINDLWKGETNCTTTGGKALKYFSSLRIEMDRTDYIKEKEKRIGFYARIKIIKSRISIPFSECQIPFLYGKGFSKIIETIDILIENLIIEKNGNWLNFEMNNEKFSFRSKWELINNCQNDIKFFTHLKALNKHNDTFRS